MERDVSPEVIKAADKCWCGHACVTNGKDGSPVCRVERELTENMLFVKPKRNIACPYCMCFGLTAHLCTCPVRREMYKRHGE